MTTLIPRRILAVSADRELQRQITNALHGTGVAVEAHDTFAALGPGEIDAALCVLHVDTDVAGASQLVARLTAGCAVIAILPRADLAGVVEAMVASERVAGTLFADDFDAVQLTALASRILHDDLFGLAKVMAPGTEIHTLTVGDYKEKTACMARISDFVMSVPAPYKHVEAIEQCMDETLMNALYNAPVGVGGAHIFAGVPTKKRITKKTAQRVVVEYAFDGKRFAVSVRDAFGSLDRATVLRFLSKGLHAEDKVDRRAGGAGLGLFLMVNTSTAVHFNVLPGIATEAVCVFDLQTSKQQLHWFGFFRQTDPAGRVASEPATVLAGPRLPLTRSQKRFRIRAALVTAAVATVAGLAVVLIPRIFGPPKPTRAFVELDSQPTGAMITIDGRPIGSAPATLTELKPGSTVAVAFTQPGYRTTTARLAVPAVGERASLVRPMELAADMVRVTFVSDPLGAEVTRTGAPPTADRTYTPTELFVEANKVQRFTLRMARHIPAVIEPFTPHPGDKSVEKSGTLVPGVTLHLEATRAATVHVAGAPHCTDAALPLDCTLAPGSYVVEVTGADKATVTRTVVIEDADVTERFELPPLAN